MTIKKWNRSMEGKNQEGKKSAFWIERKCSWGSGCTVRPSMGLWEPGGKLLEKITIFSLELVWYSLLKILKLKLSVSNEYKL